MNQQFRQTIEEYLTLTNLEIPIIGFTVNLIFAAILSFLLSQIYIRFGYTISNRKSFSRNFIIISMTTMLIISIVKSSLALSLGLVGALSIVRFRSAIKEPEELGYLFLSIAIGLGLGANQVIVTLIGFVLITGFLILKSFIYWRTKDSSNLYITLSYPASEGIDIKQVISIMEDGCVSLDLKRLDVTEDIQESSFLIEFENIEQLTSLTDKLKEHHKLISLSFLDNQGIQ